MIVIRVQGGLGNQMFQWACGRAEAIRRSTNLLLEVTPFRYDAKRKFQLNLFSNINSVLENKKVALVDGWLPSGLLQVNDDFRTFQFPSGDLFLNGYWQSEKYFSDMRDIIKKDFDLTTYSSILANYPGINDGVSMHIRRTDYVTSGGFHPVQDLNYYQNALDVINGDYSHIWVFSDDIEWCKENIKFPNCHFVHNSNETESLLLMSKCRHNITANSSFSWWAAWLNDNVDKQVVMPSKWFGEVSNLEWTNIYFQNVHTL